MADVFLEVDEQIRSARLNALFRRSWPFAVGLLVLAAVAALGVWGYMAYRDKQAAEASQAYGDAVQKLSAGDLKDAKVAFASLAQSSTPAYRTLALMQEAGLASKANDDAGAVRLLDQAASVAPNAVFADAARLEAAFDVLDTAPYDAVHARLQPLLGAGRPYRIQAREALAIARLAAGRIPEARSDFQVLSLSQDSSDTTRARASAALGMIQAGDASNLAAIAKGAVGLKPAPPPPQPAQGMAPGGDPNAQPQAQPQATPDTGAAQ